MLFQNIILQEISVSGSKTRQILIGDRERGVSEREQEMEGH